MKFGTVARSSLAAIGLLAASAGATTTPALAQAPSALDDGPGRPRVIVLSDIGNEPDDQMSLIRLLLYSNRLSVEGLVATTSIHLRDASRPDIMHRVIDGYGQVQPNLQKHERGFPTAQRLRGLVRRGEDGYGMAAVGPAKLSPGAAQIIRAGDRRAAQPLWVSIWGGANTLAQALRQVRATRTPDQTKAFVSRLRVYSISDQDNAGRWIRREFPTLSYIVKPSLPTTDEYHTATWTGIAGDRLFGNGAGADFTTVTNEWLDEHVRRGPLGRLYPQYPIIMEGDTPAFLNLIDNGLASYLNPSWGGWGGRYVHRQPYGESHAIWTQGGSPLTQEWSQDTVVGIDGKRHTSDQATIWRWRESFQHDFAARMDWTTESYRRANHNPRVRVNGARGTRPISVEARVGEPIVLDAVGTRDPDGDQLRFRWFGYSEAGAGTGVRRSSITLRGTRTARVTVTPTSVCPVTRGPFQFPCDATTGQAHVILAVTDNGKPALTSYRRVVVTVHGEPKRPGDTGQSRR